MARHSIKPDRVFQEFHKAPHGGTFHDGRTSFEWGNIKTLLAESTDERVKTVNVTTSAARIYHLDRLKKSRREEIEQSHSLRTGSIAGSLSSCKADVLIIDQRGKPFFISFKQIEGTAKLGQVSTKTTYGAATLKGGIDDLDMGELGIPTKFDHRSTSLSADSFAKVTLKDQKIAYLKRNHASEWKKYVGKRSSEATRQLRKFAKVMCSDRNSFIEFVGTTLAGSLRDSPDFFIVIGGEMVQVQAVLKALRCPKWHVTTSDASTPKKDAILLTVREGTRTAYTLTRIEHSFEGSHPKVSQTKGIIYHFQQHPSAGRNYKKLLLDLR
jgi:hypothetical protein